MPKGDDSKEAAPFGGKNVKPFQEASNYLRVMSGSGSLGISFCKLKTQVSVADKLLEYFLYARLHKR